MDGQTSVEFYTCDACGVVFNPDIEGSIFDDEEGAHPLCSACGANEDPTSDFEEEMGLR